MKAKESRRGPMPILKELLSDLFQEFDAESTSLNESKRIKPTTTADPYSGSPGVAIIEIALDEIALDEMILVNINS